MPADSPKQGLFSSLTLGRASRTPKPASETLTHPLLGASTSSLNLAADTGQNDGTTAGRNGAVDISSLPYKPRHKPGHAYSGSGSSLNATGSMSIPTGAASTSPVTAGISSSPVTPTSVSARATTSTFTSTTFALPSSATDLNDSQDLGASIGSSSTATSRLQLQSLKAAAQRIGLGNGSMGMTLIDAVFDKSLSGVGGKGKAVDNGEWSEPLKVLMSGEGVLLLPTTPASSSLPITSQNLRDHVALIGPALPDSKRQPSGSPADNSTLLVTLSGLLGTMKDSTVFFESTLSPDLVLDLCEPALSPAPISKLRPAHHSTPAAQTHFPLFALSSQSASLRFPPPGEKSGSSSNGEDLKSPASKLARMNPFSSLFGGSSSSTPPKNGIASTSSPSRELPELSLSVRPGTTDISPRPSLSSADGDASSFRSRDDTSDGYEVSAYTISKSIRYNDLAKSVSKATKALIKDELDGLPDKVVGRVVKLVQAATSSPAADDKADKVEVIQLDFNDPSSTSQKLQEFIEKVYDDLLLHYRADSSHIFSENSGTGSRLRQKASWTRKASLPTGEDDSEQAKSRRKEKARREKEEMVEREATAGADKVEGVICRLLYNRLFSPAESDDGRHDVALSSRIAALNMLELSLDHLGLITRPAELSRADRDRLSEGLAAVVDAVGHQLQKLYFTSYLTPGEKVAVLIAAHQAVVDGLRVLPPVRLRPEGEPYQAPVETPPTPLDDRQPGTPPPISSPNIPSAAPLSPTPRTIVRPSLLTRSSGSTPLSTSPATSDPLSSIAQIAEPALAFVPEPAVSPDIPHVVLTGSTHHEQVAEAMNDSVIEVRSINDAEQPTKKEDTVQLGTTSGADLILPIIIYAVVKSNPLQLASHLMYMRRYRSAICLSGEASYAIVNLTAVVDFIEHVQLADLGLGGDSEKVISVDGLSPIGLNDLDSANVDTASIATASSRLRGRVFQVGELAGSAADSANKVITGVVDSSWTAIRGLISSPAPPIDAQVPSKPDTLQEGTDSRPRGNSTSAFSLSSVTASMAGIAAAATNRNRSRAGSRASAMEKPELTWKGNEELAEVPSSRTSMRDGGLHLDTSGDAYLRSDDEEPPMGGTVRPHARRRSDARSIQSVSSVLSREREEAKAQAAKEQEKERVSLSDRLASIGSLGRQASGDIPAVGEVSKATGFLSSLTVGRGTPPPHTHARKSSLLGRADAAVGSPAGSMMSLPALPESSDPPIERFMTCEVGDIRLQEIGELLRDYRRLGTIVNAFSPHGQGQGQS